MTIKLASTVMSKKRNQTPMTAQLTMQPPPTCANARKRSGSIYAHAGTFGKDSSRLKGVTANLCDAINEQFYSQLKHRHTAYRDGALSTYKQRRNSRMPTSHSGTATSTLPRSVNVSTTTRPPSSDPISPSPTSKCTTPTCSTRPR
jgi:hypothetical protein